MSFYGKRIYNFGNIWSGFRLGNMDKENYDFPSEEDVPQNPEEILFFPTVQYGEGTIYTGNHWLQIKRGDKENSIELWHSKPGIDAATNNSLAEITKEVSEETVAELKESGHVISPHDTITTTIFHYDAAGHISNISTETYWMDDDRIVSLEDYRQDLYINIGDDTHIIYWKEGMPVESVGTVGSTIRPVWLNEGVITEFTETVGSGIKPIWMMEGDLVASLETVGSSIKPIYLQEGTITESTDTVGSDIDFIWLNAGTITKSNATIAELQPQALEKMVLVLFI